MPFVDLGFARVDLDRRRRTCFLEVIFGQGKTPSALLGMLNSCGSGVTVVNIDNGFGVACAAATINRLIG